MSTIFKSSSIARFLATLFALVVIFGLSAAVPTQISDVVEDNALDARGNSQSTANSAGATLVRMGETKFYPLGHKNDAKYGSFGFDSCLGVLIVCNGGTIIGHYTATDTAISDHAFGVNPNCASVMIPELWKQHYAELTSGLQTYIFAEANKFNNLVTELETLVHSTTGHAVTKVIRYKSSTGKDNHGAGFTVKDKKEGPSVKWDTQD